MTDILGKAYNKCFFQTPLDADDPLRVDLHAFGVRGPRDTRHDPVKRLTSVIKNADKPTQQFFSGFLGSGKSTELKRLVADLDRGGFTTVLADCEDYFNLHIPPQVNDLLAVAASSVDEQIRKTCEGSISESFRPYWEGVRKFLTSVVEIEGLTLKIPEVADLKVKLKDDVSFKTKLYDHLAQSGRASDLARQCHKFLDEAVGNLSKACPGTKGLVLVVDSFEKVRGNPLDPSKVREAMETIFIQDWKLLCLPFHVIYTVPPWLTFLDVGVSAGRVCILPMCRLTDRDSRERVAEGFAAMRTILEKRMPMAEIFVDPRPLDELIAASGGYPRDLLRMMQEVLLSAIMEEKSLPISAEDLSRIVKEVIREQVAIYSKPIYDEDLPLLVEVARTLNVPTKERARVLRIAELFDHHFVLGYLNGQE